MARERVTYTVKVNTAKDFNELAIKKNINRSSLINELMEKWIEENREEQKSK
jgi:metal-responsive CopG/Arc/MetJ family transcriptional regulator